MCGANIAIAGTYGCIEKKEAFHLKHSVFINRYKLYAISCRDVSVSYQTFFRPAYTIIKWLTSVCDLCVSLSASAEGEEEAVPVSAPIRPEGPPPQRHRPETPERRDRQPLAALGIAVHITFRVSTVLHLNVHTHKHKMNYNIPGNCQCKKRIHIYE